MKNLFKRFCSYFIDIIIVYLIVYSLTNIPFINIQLKDYNKSYKNYEEEYLEYMDFLSDLEEYYKDNKLTQKEYNKLIKNDNEEYIKLLDEYYKDNKLTKTGYSSLVKDLNRDFQKKYKKNYYNISKNSTIYNIIYIIVLLAYFVGFNTWTHGQTIGKKILKLKIVSNNGNKKVSWINYLIRTIILYNPIYYLAILIGPYIFNINNFYNWSFVWSNIKNYLDILIVIMIIIRTDRRGIHELLSNTKVIFLSDKSIDNIVVGNNEIEETVIKKANNSKKNNKKTKKVVIDEEN